MSAQATLRRKPRAFKRSEVTAHLAGDPAHETGRLIALIDEDGERSFLTIRGANEKLVSGDIPDALIAGASHIHLSGYSVPRPPPRARRFSTRCGARAENPSASIRRRGKSARDRRGHVLAWTKGASILFPNAEEAAILAGSEDPETQCARLGERYPLIVVKRGAAGAEAAQGARRWRVKAPKIEAIDTTGAGDAFVAAFLAARLAGADIQASLERAAAAGAAASTVVGGRPKASGVHASR